MTLKVLLVDDEAPARARLRQVLVACAAGVPLTVVDEAVDGRGALAAVDRVQPDVVLLDIAMPGRSGLEVARHLAARPQPPAVIFTTAHDEHALRAFEVHALDYLLKPVTAARLAPALARAQRLAYREPRLDALAESLGAVRTQLTVSERGRLLLVPIEEIVYLRAELKYVTIRTAAREYLTEESLTALEAEFGARFVRVHRNALVARAAIVGFERVRGLPEEDGTGGDGHWVVLLRGVSERLPISRRQWTAVKAAAPI